MCNRSLKQTAVSLSSCEAEYHAASACARELLGLAELFKELHYDVAVRLEMDSDSARHLLQRKGPGGPKHIEIQCLARQQCTREKRPSVSRVDTKNNTADLFTKRLDGLRTHEDYLFACGQFGALVLSENGVHGWILVQNLVHTRSHSAVTADPQVSTVFAERRWSAF